MTARARLEIEDAGPQPNRLAALSPSARAIYRGMVWLMRHEPRWLVDVLARRKFLPPGRYIEQLPTEVWPVDECNSEREVRADLVMRLWSERPPEAPMMSTVESRGVIGLLGDFHVEPDPERELQLFQYGWAYQAVLGQDIRLAVLTLEEKMARWARDLLVRIPSRMRYLVLTPNLIRRSEPIDPVGAPRRVLLETMLHGRTQRSLKLLMNALRALRRFSGHELLIYREMLQHRIGMPLIVEAYKHIEDEADNGESHEPCLSQAERRSYLYVRGSGEGRARAVLDLLRDRGIDPDAATESRILACRDADLLRAWLVRAATITRLDELFE